jgi:hypothetical protein
MLKNSQDYVLRRKLEKKAKVQMQPNLTQNESQEFLSVNSNFTQQNAELTDALMAQAELLKSPSDMVNIKTTNYSKKSTLGASKSQTTVKAGLA